ncbi:hypothetical protein ACIRG4_34995 [Streptomyces sp. NPDC102395]|uniref:hypothetical protein n=1 Tax=Streptomyces sp. NPDC102395 TaxID=3366168 RepID=UPI0037FDACE8
MAGPLRRVRSAAAVRDGHDLLPVTDLAPDADPCADSFALDEAGCVLLATLQEWTRECVPSAIWGIANTIIQFTENVLRQEGEDIVDTLKTMRTEHLERARAA